MSKAEAPRLRPTHRRSGGAWGVAALLLLGCVHNTQPSTREVLATEGSSVSAQLTKLEGWMIGSFENTAQAAADPSYPAAKLSACKVESPIGPRVIYMELTANGSTRQWLYALGTDGSNLRLKRYALSNPAGLIGLCSRSGARVDSGYVEEPGCMLAVRGLGDHFEGATAGTACPGPGVRYVTTELRVSADRVEAWERGYDGAGGQVSGGNKGPLKLVRR